MNRYEILMNTIKDLKQQRQDAATAYRQAGINPYDDEHGTVSAIDNEIRAAHAEIDQLLAEPEPEYTADCE